MNNDYVTLKYDLDSLGLTKGDTVLIHSSYKSMGGLDGGIATLVDALLSVIGDRGTLIAPTLSYKSVTPDNPTFNYLETPSCVGAISEFIRNHEASVRSIHPTHSCSVIGYATDYYIKDHELDRTPVGEHSPFRKLMECGGKILMLGCGANCNTSFHGIEEIADVPYVLTNPPITHTLVLPGRTYTAEYRRHSILQNGYAQRYARAVDILSADALRIGEVHGAESYLFDANKMMKHALEVLKKDKFFFVERVQQ